MMYARASTGAVIALIPKVGMQSMRHALRSNGDLPLEEALAAPVRVLFLRDPVERLASAYCFFRTIYAFGSTPSPNAPQPAHVANWDSFMEHVRANPGDPHWRPQIETVREFRPTAIHRFEDIDQHWSKYHARRFPHLNESDPHDTGEIPPDIMARYAEENALWRGL